MGGSGPGTAKLCDTCKSLSASLFCRADSAFLCLSCDSRVHAANKLASRHARVWVCEVCEHAPASVTCKADAAHLCVTCDHDIHSANPLARRHERVPITPFFEVNQSETPETGDTGGAALIKSNTNATIDKLFGEDYYPDVDEEEAQAASWLLTNPSVNPEAKGSGKLVESGDPKSIDYLFADDDVDPYLDLDFSADPKADLNASADCMVPDQKANRHIQNQPSQLSFYSLASYNSQFDDAYENASKPFSLPYSSRQAAVSQSVSSSSMDVGVVPDASAVADVSKGLIGAVAAVSGLDREARVLRYREKRKNRKFEKTIRYASRKAYAETRPRIKGRFAKRTDMDVGRGAAAAAASEGVVVGGVFGSRQDLEYDAVPSF